MKQPLNHFKPTNNGWIQQSNLFAIEWNNRLNCLKPTNNLLFRDRLRQPLDTKQQSIDPTIKLVSRWNECDVEITIKQIKQQQKMRGYCYKNRWGISRNRRELCQKELTGGLETIYDRQNDKDVTNKQKISKNSN